MTESFISLYQQLSDYNFWTLEKLVGVIGAVSGVTAIVLAYWPLHQQRRAQRLLAEEFGADFYDSSQIENAAQYYVRPDCSSVDPAQEVEMRHVIATKEDLFDAIDRYVVNNSVHRHILLLADSGMGKSSFVLSYYARNRRLRKRKRLRLAVIPLGRPDALAEIARIENQKNTILFLDAFDEDTKAIQDYRSRLAQLMEACSRFKCVLITCRTQFFLKDDEIPRQTGIVRVGPRKPGEGSIYEFWKLYILPLSDDEVEEFIRHRYRIWAWRKRKKAREAVSKIPLLSVRPMLLAFVPELLEDDDYKIDFSVQLYDQMVNKWLERERGWVNQEELRAFSENLAVDLYINRERRESERISREELSQLLKAYPIPIDEWKVTGRSLLNRDGQGNFKFAHRSIMEYLFVRSFFNGDKLCQDIEWTDLMKRFFLELVYLHYQGHDPAPLDLSKADLTNTEDIMIPTLYQLRSRPITINNLVASLASSRLESGQAFDPMHIFALQHRNEADLVIDHASGLMWQQCGSEGMLNLDEAQRYIESLNSSNYCNYDNWRLPTADEVVITMGGANSSSVPFDPDRLTFWTIDKTSRGYGLYYLYAQLRVQTPNSTAYVRAVRTIAAASVRGQPYPRFGQPKVLAATS